MDVWAGVVMAAGAGTRMKSKTPKVLHKLCGRELLTFPVEALKDAGIGRVVVVVSSDNVEGIKALLGDSVQYALQDRPLGTGHALLQAAPLLGGQAEHVVVLNGDSPLVRPETLESLCARHLSGGSAITLLSAPSWPDEGMAMIVRDGDGQVTRIVEAKDMTGDEGTKTFEANGGAYCFRAEWLWENLPRVEKAPVGEFYLTTLVSMAAAQVAGVQAVVSQEAQEVLGINDRRQLARAEAAMRQRIRDRWMREGVTMLDPASTFVDASAVIGQDTVIYPNTMILGRSQVGSDCLIGPSTLIQDSHIGDGCKVVASVLEEAVMEESVDMGPFAHLRPGAYLETGVHLGNFAEVKNSRLGRDVTMGHFGYVGDASIGAGVNLGAGLVTCNYDGVQKHRTVVEEGAFIGCDTMFVAPVKIGAGAVTGAGAVVTKDVPPHRLAVGVPAKIVESKKSRAVKEPSP